MWLFMMLTAVAAAADRGAERPVVTLPASCGGGTAEGVHLHSALGHRYSAFYGIPFAQPPVGELRFRPPLPHPGWTGVRDTSKQGPVCAQLDASLNFAEKGEEDCLYLNVFRPDPVDSTPALLPVMVFIHGGAFVSGSGTEQYLGMDYLMDGEVVVVTFNYRLSIFGFLTTDDAEASGNYGLLDQVMALRWVRDNIATFGGDPRRVTAFGVSAGGVSVSLQVVSPLSRGLFQRAISQSGSALAPWAIAGPQNNLTLWYAEQLQCPTSGDSQATMECLRKIPTGRIMEVQKMLGGQAYSKGYVFIPRVDSETDSPFLPEHPSVLLAAGKFNRVPMINGIVESEGLFFIDNGFLKLAQKLASGPEAPWIEALGRSELVDASEASYLSAEIGTYYQRLDGNISLENLTPLVNLRSDWDFTVAASIEADLASQYVPVYRYILDHKGPGKLRFFDMLGITGVPDKGVMHADDLAYLFRSQLQKPVNTSSPGYTMVSLMVSLWTNFARLGYPKTNDVLPDLRWPVFNSGNMAYLRINSEASTSAGLFQERVEFWKALGFKDRWLPPAAQVPK